MDTLVDPFEIRLAIAPISPMSPSAPLDTYSARARGTASSPAPPIHPMRARMASIEAEVEWFDRSCIFRHDDPHAPRSPPPRVVVTPRACFSPVMLPRSGDPVPLEAVWAPTLSASFESWRLARGWSSDDD